MSEEFLQHIWHYRLFHKENLKTIEGEYITVIHPGMLNTDGGPDFFNAKVKIGNTIWAGNIEIHKKASDWFAHKHNTDKAYDNVILHLAYTIDVDTDTAFSNDGKNIQLAKLVFDERLKKNYDELLNNRSEIACNPYIDSIDSFTLSYWLEKLLIERLEEKTTQIETRLKQNKNNWEETFYYKLCRNFGFKLNALPFEMLAQSLPMKYLAKHKNNLFQLEALLFGQAGFLNEDISDDYFQQLKKEYKFLAHKYSLKPLEKHLWKFLRLRPVNFPTLRISQLAQLVHKSSALFSKVIEIVENKSPQEAVIQLSEYFDLQASEYWNTHYVFGKESKKRKKSFGKNAFNMVLINTIVTFAFTYGKTKDNQKLKNSALKLFENIEAEKNNIIKRWNNYGHKTQSAYQTQAYYQLTNVYCNQKRCLKCAIGNKRISDIQ